MPAIAVVAKSPRVVEGLASHTRRSTLGRAAVVPVTDCFRFSHRPRRSLGPSGTGGCSSAGAPVRPLLACPVSGFFRPPAHQCIIGGPPPPIIPISTQLRRAGGLLTDSELQRNYVIMDEKEF